MVKPPSWASARTTGGSSISRLTHSFHIAKMARWSKNPRAKSLIPGFSGRTLTNIERQKVFDVQSGIIYKT